MSVVTSVVIPAYNAAAFIHGAITSALSQTLREIEVIVVDDGSTDATWDLITEFASRDPRVVPVRRARRGGPSAALNTGIERATGRWIAVLDADDTFLPERLAELIRHGEAVGADLVADNLRLRDFETGEDLGLALPDSMMAFEGPLPLIEMVRRDMPDMPSRNRLGFIQPVKRRDFLQRTGVRFQEDVATGEDFLFYFECVARGARLHLLPGAWYVYALRTGSITSTGQYTPHLGLANRRQIRMAEELGDTGLAALLRRRQTMIEFAYFRQLLGAGRLSDGFAQIRHIPLAYLAARMTGAAGRRIAAGAAAILGPLDRDGGRPGRSPVPAADPGS